MDKFIKQEGISHMNLHRLNVCIPARDRTVLTLKCIESIHGTSKLFTDINVYVFDNLSNMDISRMNMFSKLLATNQIKHYSYDTSQSTYDCFPKPIIFRRWASMMIDQYELYNKIGKEPNIKDVYMLLDNDMILGPDWDSYFITALDNILKYSKEIKFIVKYPGGIPLKFREHAPSFKLTNRYKNNEEFEVITSNFGGGSGCWVMDIKMLKYLTWSIEEISKTLGKFKGHDTATWARIRKEFNDTQYVAAVKPRNLDTNPLIIHMGAGSMCMSLNKNEYGTARSKFSGEESKYRDMSYSEIFQQNKGKGTW